MKPTRTTSPRTLNSVSDTTDKAFSSMALAEKRRAQEFSGYLYRRAT